MVSCFFHLDFKENKKKILKNLYMYFRIMQSLVLGYQLLAPVIFRLTSILCPSVYVPSYLKETVIRTFILRKNLVKMNGRKSDNFTQKSKNSNNSFLDGHQRYKRDFVVGFLKPKTRNLMMTNQRRSRRRGVEIAREDDMDGAQKIRKEHQQKQQICYIIDHFVGWISFLE